MGQWVGVISISTFRLSCHHVKNEGNVGRKKRKAWAEVGGWSRTLGILGENWTFWAAVLDVCPGRKKSQAVPFSHLHLPSLHT